MQSKLSILGLIFLISVNCLAMEQRDLSNQSKQMQDINSLLKNFNPTDLSDQNNIMAAYYDLTEDEQLAIISANPILKSILNLDDPNENDEDMQDDSKNSQTTNFAPTNTNSILQTQNSKFEPMDITSDDAATLLEDTASNANALSSQNEELNKVLEKALETYSNLADKNKQIAVENRNLQDQIFQLKQEIDDSKQILTARSSSQADARTARACQMLVALNRAQHARIEELKKLKDNLLKNLNN